MKRLVAVLSGLLVLPAFAEVAPIFYDDAIEYADWETPGDGYVADEVEEMEVSSVAAPITSGRTSTRNATGRVTASRAVPTNSGQTNASSRAVPSSRGVSARATNATRTSATTPSRATTARATVSRASTTTGAAASSAGTGAATRRATDAANANKAVAARASIIQTDTVNKPLYTGRVGVRGSSSIGARVPTVRMASASTTSTTSTSSVAEATNDMDELAQITDFCKAQYTQCMDNFCNVLDDNQGRCSCSKNLKNYEKTENALKQATEELQNVAQQIQYIGLSSDDVESLFVQTEAEATMQNKTDNTKLKNDLDRIKNMIVNVKSGTASAVDTSVTMDLSSLLDFSIDSTGFDLSALFGGGSSSNTSSISNQRGETLYKTAAARCKASVLNSCSAQGVDISVITNSYDLEIDKQCIAYERSLNDSNDQMASTVRNAKSVLQKARLLVAQQKNQYDLRGCINALDSCMQDDFVCGSDYENCLDPTGKYIVNGEIVSGGQPGVSGGEYDATTGKAQSGLYAAWDYAGGNAWNKGNLGDFIATNSTARTDMLGFLKDKIGTIDGNNKVQGYCASVLTKCQDYTYTGTGNQAKYNANNQVISGFLERVLIQIKAAQDEKLASHAESCIADVATCLSQNGSTGYGAAGVVTGTTTAPSDVAIRACMSVINTCKSVTERKADVSSVYEWLNQALRYDFSATMCTNTGGTWSNSACTCPLGTQLKNGVCAVEDDTETRHTNCTSTSGTWSSSTNTCTCRLGMTLNAAGMCTLEGEKQVETGDDIGTPVKP